MSKYSSKINKASEFFHGRKNPSTDRLTPHQLPVYSNANSYPFPVSGQEDTYSIDLDRMKSVLLEEFANYEPLENHEGTEFISKRVKGVDIEPEYTYECNWYPNDSKELFTSNMEDPVAKSLLYKLGWTDKRGQPTPIKYQLNKNGFRCKNVNDKTKNGILFLGCSHTFGVGLIEEQTFAHRVATHFNRECFNYGLPGKGLDTAALYTSLFLAEDLDPTLIDAIVIFMPPPGRVSFFTYEADATDVKNRVPASLHLSQLQNDALIPTNYYQEHYLSPIPDADMNNAAEVFNIQPTDTKEEIDKKLDAGFRRHIDEHRSRMWEHLMFTKENNFYRTLLAVNSIKSFALEHNVPFVVQEGTEAVSNAHDWARDIAHFGPLTHNNISKDIISKLNIHLT